MATVAQTLPSPSLPFSSLWEFLKGELAPYPGRIEVVARMVLAATLIMLICMTFQIPYAFQSALMALLMTRESPRATLRFAAMFFLFFFISVVYLLISDFVINYVSLHFLWVIATLFVGFYLLSAMSNYGLAVTFAIAISITIPLWDRHVPGDINVDDTLWLLLAEGIGLTTTVIVELVFVRSKPGDQIVLHLGERLTAVENLLLSYAEHSRPDPAAAKDLIRLDILGTSGLRRLLRVSDYSLHYRSQMNGVVALVGRLVNIAAARTELSYEPTITDRQQARSMAATIAGIRTSLLNRQIPAPVNFNLDAETLRRVPLLREMMTIVSLIPLAFVGSGSIGVDDTPDVTPPPLLFVRDAFVNPDHLRFALKGCLAASACYIIYNAIAWPGISTAVMTTCLLTALSTIGASRQKQVLRFGGALVGGIFIGMGAQIFLLPYVDTIVGFTVLFIAVTALACWILTSSPRLSYFGLQLALAFYLIHLQEFAFQTSLAIARDRVVGVLLGLFMMWLVFDQIWGDRAALEMRKTFISGLRLLAQLAREPTSSDPRIARATTSALRETIAANFDLVRSLADGVVFEFGATRQHDLILRSHVLRWQPQLRILLTSRVALWRHRAQEPGFELPAAIEAVQQDFDYHQAAVLDGLADKLDGKPYQEDATFAASLEHLDQAVQTFISKESDEVLATRLQTLLSLCRRTESLTTALQEEILRPATDFGL
jgi:multidrug resistance protein MdtO